MSFTESVYLDAVSADGRTGFVARLARHVDEGVAWLWLHAFLPEGVFAFHRDDIAINGAATPDTDAGANYTLEADSMSASFARTGAKARPDGAVVTIRLPAVGAALAATFHPAGPAGSNLPGRTEVLGRVSAEVTTPDGKYTIDALGQFHEQHQTTPRFTVPFTYGTLRGEDLGLVFLIAPRVAAAFVRSGEHVDVAREVRISSVGDDRTLDLELASGSKLQLELTRTHHYMLAINGHPRESSIVVASTGDRTLSGCVNDWDGPAH